MKKIVTTIFILFFYVAVTRGQNPGYYSDTLFKNGLRAHFNTFGTFDRILFPSSSGLFCPNIAICNTAGLCIAAYVNGEIRNASASYRGEYTRGCVRNGVFYYDSTFVIYKVSKGDIAQNNPYWMNWGSMVPYGAPYIDVNNNNIYEPLIDTPGVKNAAQTIFMCITDAYQGNHSSGEGFGGGTLPMNAEMHITAWCYDNQEFTNVQFIKWEIINKGIYTWNKAMIGIFYDPDLGGPFDDYSACDTNLSMTICYNAFNNDPIFGSNPPAFGIKFLRSSYNRAVLPNKYLGLTSFITLYQGGAPQCVYNDASFIEAYRVLAGFKKDSSSNWDPTYSPYRKTKYCFPGDPETNFGWTNIKGYLWGCGDTNLVLNNVANDVRCVMSSGAYNFNIVPGEKQTIVIAQMLAGGTSNLNSVTKLKQLAQNVQSFYDLNFPININNISFEVPSTYSLYQNYPNPFNPTTKIKFDIAANTVGQTFLSVYDITGREIQTLVNEKLNPGTYEVTFDGSNFASGVYFYQLSVGNDIIEFKKMILLK
jgi:hypothetical protein